MEVKFVEQWNFWEEQTRQSFFFVMNQRMCRVACCYMLRRSRRKTWGEKGMSWIWFGYLMKNFEVLGKFSFDISPSKKNLQQEILMFPRDSSLPGLCKIEVLWYACFLVSQSYNISPFEAVNTFTFILWTESNFWVRIFC